MPGISGIETCSRLKADARTRDIPVIFLTALSDRSDEQRGLETGAVDYIAKPISAPILIARVKTHLALKSAADFLHAEFPSLERVVLWSLCDGSAACSLNAASDPRIGGMILSNPYVHSAQGQAKAFLKHYYLRRILDPGFWKKIATGRFNPFKAVGSMKDVAKAASGGEPAKPIAGITVGPGEDPPELPKKVMDGLQAFRGPMRLILSTDDLTAHEFLELFKGDVNKRKGPRSERDLRFVEGADHTFTQAEWKAGLSALSIEAWETLTAKEGQSHGTRPA